MRIKRKFRGKAVEMLTTCAAIIENAIANHSFLFSKRHNWTIEFFEEIRTRIQRAYKLCIGVDTASGQREATALVSRIQADAMNDLAEVKIQIEQDFKRDKPQLDEILRLLGFSGYFAKALKRDQSALVTLLFRFQENLTDDLRTDITDRGTADETLERIVSFADELAGANITQETLKSNRKVLTEDIVNELNDIYDEVISIAKIARNFYKGDLAKQQEFSYEVIQGKTRTATHTPPQK